VQSRTPLGDLGLKSPEADDILPFLSGRIELHVNLLTEFYDNQIKLFN